MKDVYATVIVDLTPSENEIFTNLERGARKSINKAKREGLTVEESNEWDEFYKIYGTQMKVSYPEIRLPRQTR